nr:hypothetical protein [uncultured Xanthomonas sp.]
MRQGLLPRRRQVAQTLLRRVGQRAPAGRIRTPAGVARTGPRQRLLVVLGGQLQHLRSQRLVQSGDDAQQQRQAVGRLQAAQMRQRRRPGTVGGIGLAQGGHRSEQLPEPQRPVGHRQRRGVAAEGPHRRRQGRHAAFGPAALQVGQDRGAAFDAAQERGQGGRCGHAVGRGRGGHRDSIIGAMIARQPPHRALDSGVPIGSPAAVATAGCAQRRKLACDRSCQAPAKPCCICVSRPSCCFEKNKCDWRFFVQLVAEACESVFTAWSMPVMHSFIHSRCG